MRVLACLLLTAVAVMARAADAPTPATPTPQTVAPASAGPAEPHLKWNVEKALGPSPDAIRLEPVEVTGHRDAFAESDQRLKKAAAALPCNGCGGPTAKEKEGLVETMVTDAVDLLKAGFVAPEHAADQPELKDRAEAEAEARPLIRPGQDP